MSYLKDYFNDQNFQLKKAIKTSKINPKSVHEKKTIKGTSSCPTTKGIIIETTNTKNNFSKNPNQNL